MKTPAFDLPDGVEVSSLLIERLNETSLKPDSPVYCVNRGRKPLELTFNGNHVVVPVGLFLTEYRAAQHFKDRAVVPGTRNLEVGGHVSWISIIGSEDRRLTVDPPDTWEPFTDEELQRFGESIEAIDRGALSGIDRFVTPIRTQTARAMSRSQGQGMNVAIDAGTQVSDAAAEAAAHVFDPPTEPLATRASEAEASVERGGGVVDDGPAPEPRPMRNRQRR